MPLRTHRLRRSSLPAAGLVCCALVAAAGCDSALPEHGSAAAPAAGPVYTDRAAEVGLDFVHFNGMSGELYFCEPVGAGGAFFDYDNDGDLDVYLVQGAMLGENKQPADALFPPQGPLPLRDRLYRNDLEIRADGTRRLHFTDVTEASRIEAFGYGMGVATGDYDNDGWVDLYVTNFGPDQLWHNNGNGTFSDATERTGTSDPRWSTSAAFVDYDRDGWLDLFVANYVNFSLRNHRPCFSKSGRRDYCGPLSYDPEPHRLLRNRGDGTFEDVSGKAGIFAEYGSGLGVVAGDYDNDGWLDLCVANDGMANFLWMNQRDGTFRNMALVAGAAVNARGEAEAGMGVDAADFDRDGDEDLFITHLDAETNTLYVNDGKGMFEDRTAASKLGPPSMPFTGFGTAFTDYDNDGWLDVVVVNGAVKALEPLALAGDPYPLDQSKLLFHNLRDGTFADTTRAAGEAFARTEVSRGAAFGDVDEDGDQDVLVTNNSGPVRLLINEVGQERHWVGLRLVDPRRRRDMLGARVEIVLGHGERQMWRVRTGASYLSANDPRALFGLGDGTALARVRVAWPDGPHEEEEEEWNDVPVDRYTTLNRGSGRPPTRVP